MCPDRSQTTAPFEPVLCHGESVAVSTTGKILVLPTGDSSKLPSFNECTLDTNRLTIAESPFGGRKGSQALNVAVGSIHTPTAGVRITDTAGNNGASTISATNLLALNMLTINSTNKTLTEEFIIENTSTSNTPSTITSCDATTDWGAGAGFTFTIDTTEKIEGTGCFKLEVVGAGRYLLNESARTFTNQQFITVSMKAAVGRIAYFYIYTDDSNYRYWQLNLSASWQTFVIPLNCSYVSQTGTVNLASISKISIDFAGFQIGDIVYIDNIVLDSGKPAYVEIQVPDTLAAASLEIQCWDGAVYQSCRKSKLDSTWSDISTTPANVKFLETTKLDDVYGAKNGRAVFVKGDPNATVSGSTGTVTYSGVGSLKRIGLQVNLPPSDSGRTTFNKIRLKTIITYLPVDNPIDYGVGTLYIPTSGVVLSDTSGYNEGSTLSAGKLKELSLLTVDTTAKTITEEFIISNTNATSTGSTVVDACNATTGWATTYGVNPVLTSENGRLVLNATTDASNRARISKNFATPFTTAKFIKFDIECTYTGTLFFELRDTSQAPEVYATWRLSRFPITANTPTTFTIPIFAPVGSTGMNPQVIGGGTALLANSNIRIYIGVDAAPGTAGTTYFDNFITDQGCTTDLEISTPDYLAESSLEIQCWDGAAYQTCRTSKLDSAWSDVSTTPANVKFLDVTKLDSVYGAELGRAVFPKGSAGETKTGSTGTITYSANKGAQKRIGLRVTMPPLGTFAPNFSKIRLKTILTYAAGGDGKYSSSYEFSDSTNASYGLQNLAKSWIALYNSANTDLDFYLFSYRPKNIVIRKDDTGEIYETVLYPGNGNLYYGSIFYSGLTTDTDTDLIPDCLDSNVSGSVTSFLSPYGFVSDVPSEIAFTTTGAAFAPNIVVSGTPEISWRFADGSTSNSSNPSVSFGSSASRVHTLKVTPWSALRKINVGYNGIDGGATPGEATLIAKTQQNVSKINGLQLATHLEMFASSYNPITALDFSNLTHLTTIEAFQCTSLTSLTLLNNSAVTRLCVERGNLASLDLSQTPALQDLRASDQATNSLNINWGTTGASTWHICTWGHTLVPPIPLSQFPVLRELFIWATGTSGTLTLTQTTLTQVKVSSNSITAVVIPDGCTALKTIEFNDNLLPEAQVDYVLAKFDTIGGTNGSCDIHGNAVPSAAGLVSKANLEAKGWTVITD